MSEKKEKSQKKRPKYEISLPEAVLHITKGNSKLGEGIYTFSTLPGNEDNLLYVDNGETLLTDIPGTCSKFCTECFKGGCYAARDARLHNNVTIKAWGENTLLLRAGKLFEEVDAFITQKNGKYNTTKNIDDAKIRTFRINVSGEMENLQQVESWNALAARHPEVTFGVYTKNFEALEEFMAHHPAGTAPNFVINVSQWHGVANEFIAKYPGKFNIFEYDDSRLKSCTLKEEDKLRLAGTTHCPAVTPEGRHAKDASGKDITCDRCGRCYRKTGKTTAVYAH